MVALEDEAAQRHGLVCVAFGFKIDTRLTMKVKAVVHGIPIRYAACHICLFNDKLSGLARFVISMAGVEARLRYLVHPQGERTGREPKLSMCY